MPKKGENIYRRKDGRWEGRYIKGHLADGKTKYAYVYGKTYSDVKQKLIDDRIPIREVAKLAQPFLSMGNQYGEG